MERSTWRALSKCFLMFSVVAHCSNFAVCQEVAAKIWEVIRPVTQHAAVIEAILKDPQFSQVYFDISWDEVAKIAADLINRYPDRFLFGTDEVAPKSQEQYLRVYYQYDPLWMLLSTEANRESPQRQLRADL